MIPDRRPTDATLLRALVRSGLPRGLDAAYRLREALDLHAAAANPEERTAPSVVPFVLRRAAGRLFRKAAAADEVRRYVAAVRARLPAGEALLPEGPAERTTSAALAAGRDDLPIAVIPEVEIMTVLAVEMLRDLALSEGELDDLFASAEQWRASIPSAVRSADALPEEDSAVGHGGPPTISGRYLHAAVRLDEATANRLQAELGRLRSDDDLVVFDEAFGVAVDRMFAHEHDDLGIVRFLTAVRRRYQLDDDGLPIPEAEAFIRRSLGQRVPVPAMSVSAELGIKGAVFMGVMHELGLSDAEVRASIAEAERRAIAAGYRPSVFAA